MCDQSNSTNTNSLSSQLISTFPSYSQLTSTFSLPSYLISTRAYEPGGSSKGESTTTIIKKLGSDPHLEKVSIIAMKGHPFTRKTEFATLIGASLGCPVFSLEHFLAHLQPPLSREAEDQAFQIICTMAQYHLFSGVSKNVVIDSALSSMWHLSQLTEVASSVFQKQARVVIVECKPMNVYLWQMKLEEHLARHPCLTQKWYKPKSWEDVERAIRVNVDYDERSVDDHNIVSKLVVDPLLDHPLYELTTLIYQAFFKQPPMTPRFIEAVRYMISRDAGDGPSVVVYNQWKRSHYHSSSSSFTRDEKKDNDGRSVIALEKRVCSEVGHNIVSNSGEMEGLTCKSSCRACQNQFMRSDDDIYSCKDCSLTLHKECAEFFDNNNTCRSPFPKERFPRKYCFPEEFPCTACREMGKGFSDKCASCLFETHLKCRLMPTVINHVDTEEHFLTIVLLPTLDNEYYRCVVCGQIDQFNIYLCRICGIAYHYKCVTLPRRVKHVHGGHHHHLSLKFSSNQEEDYLCDECLEKRDPGLWFYSCEECPYEVHPSCVDNISF